MGQQGTAYFIKELPFQMTIDGSINGQTFTVEGKGTGNSQEGTMNGKWVCTSGQLPLSWAAIAATLGYGFKCFASFPKEISHFFQECMPQGYSQERVTCFEEDGTLMTYHEISLVKGVIMNKVTVKGVDFKSYSPVLKNGLQNCLPTIERTFPFENGVKSIQHRVFPLKDGEEYLLATQTTVNRPLGKKRNISLPPPHFTRSEIKQSKDTDNSDHVVQDELIEGFHLSLMDNYF